MKPIYPALVLTGLAVAGAVGFVYSGWFYVGADASDSAVMHWLLHRTMERSVATRAAGVHPEPDLDNPALIRIGAEHYQEMCVKCHLAPGMASTDIREGLNPKPPRLEHPAAHMSGKALFWVIKHGVRITAMPAWGQTHPDHKIWALVAFVKQLAGMTETQYNALTGGSEASSLPGGDQHE